MFPTAILLFCVFAMRIVYLCTTDYMVGNETITAFIKNRNTKEETLLPKRGSILDKNGNVLAEDVASYTVIAYLDKSRSEGSKTPLHVVDPDITAERLAPYLNMDVEVLKILLKKDAYQVELGPGGRNLSQIQMEEIKNLNLPGIDFLTSTKRYYPNGDFASYAIGYTVNEEDSDKNTWKVGQLGIEEYYNESLTGRSGYKTYEKDRNGYKIANGREYVEEAENGDNIYLTIDSNIQLFTENAVKKMMTDSEAEWGFMITADAKTGAILSYATAPSFDPNKKNLTNYNDLMTGLSYEPGSTMKIFSYLCAMDKGQYDGNSTYTSGEIEYVANDGSKTVVHDWNKVGWGVITYDYGFAMSSNVGAAGLLRSNMIDKRTLKSCYNDYGFGKKTGFTLKREVSGKVKFNYDVDAASATFGQAITITPIQMIQALTAISNDGKLLRPYIVSKIVDANTKKTKQESTTEIIDVVSNTENISRIKTLMKSVVCPDSTKCTGSPYYMEGYPIMGKTGTAQIYDETTGTYMKGASDYIYSFAGIYPSDNPEIIIYTGLKRPKDTVNYVAPAVKDVVVNTSKYLNIVTDTNKTTTYTLKNYINKVTSTIKNELETKTKLYVLGTGEKIISQYPSEKSKLYQGSVVALLTDTYDKAMPNLIGLSYKDAMNILKLMGVKYNLDGKGYVVSQSIPEGIIVGDDVTVTLTLNGGLSE